MALRAVRTEFAVVYVVELVAIRTITAEFRVRVQGAAMTRFAANVGVRAVQCEIRLAIVIEKPLRPGNGVVAFRAVCAEAPIVRVVLGVAVHALFGGISENMRIVALAALDCCVLAEQRKARQIVVEEDVVRPGRFVVAVVTTHAKGL